MRSRSAEGSTFPVAVAPGTRRSDAAPGADIAKDRLGWKPDVEHARLMSPFEPAKLGSAAEPDMINLSKSDDFHDGNLLAINLDLLARRLTVRVEAYLSQEGPRVRTPITFTFSNVHSFSSTADLKALKEHAMFGNIAHWTPSKGVNLISLAAGTIVFEAKAFEVSLGVASDP